MNLQHQVSNRNPRAAAAAGMAGWTDSGYYGLPRHGLPYSRPVQLRRHPPPAMRIRANGDGSANVFRLAGPGIINVTIGGVATVQAPPQASAAAKERAEVMPDCSLLLTLSSPALSAPLFRLAPQGRAVLSDAASMPRTPLCIAAKQRCALLHDLSLRGRCDPACGRRCRRWTPTGRRRRVGDGCSRVSHAVRCRGWR